MFIFHLPLSLFVYVCHPVPLFVCLSFCMYRSVCIHTSQQTHPSLLSRTVFSSFFIFLVMSTPLLDTCFTATTLPLYKPSWVYTLWYLKSRSGLLPSESWLVRIVE